MLSSFRIRIGNISPSATQWHFPLWKWVTKTPKRPFPLARRGPHVVQQCLTPPHAPPQTDSWGTVAHRRRKVPIGYNGAPTFVPQVPLPVDRSRSRTTCLIPGPVRPMMPNGIRIWSAVFPQCTGQTDAQADKSSTRKFDHYRPLRL